MVAEINKKGSGDDEVWWKRLMKKEQGSDEQGTKNMYSLENEWFQTTNDEGNCLEWNLSNDIVNKNSRW